MSTDDVVLESSLQLYPNPTKGKLQLKTSNQVEIEQVILYTIQGRAVRQLQLNNNEVDLHNYADGVYLLQIKTNRGMITKRVVKY